MDIKKLSDCLRPWIQMDTWHTAHPNDTERFNKALLDAVGEFGAKLDERDVEEALQSLAEELYPNRSSNETDIRRFVLVARHILGFLRDNKISI